MNLYKFVERVTALWGLYRIPPDELRLVTYDGDQGASWATAVYRDGNLKTASIHLAADEIAARADFAMRCRDLLRKTCKPLPRGLLFHPTCPYCGHTDQLRAMVTAVYHLPGLMETTHDGYPDVGEIVSKLEAEPEDLDEVTVVSVVCDACQHTLELHHLATTVNVKPTR